MAHELADPAEKENSVGDIFTFMIYTAEISVTIACCEHSRATMVIA